MYPTPSYTCTPHPEPVPPTLSLQPKTLSFEPRTLNLERGGQRIDSIDIPASPDYLPLFLQQLVTQAMDDSERALQASLLKRKQE